ncbi:hypothetical protein [Streptococcus pseudoporcinus]|uniref:Uncharacterized protein n=1 Tax=Streptococcus pseudoporcinus LQ 940-04 TaxID=875093 RepID=G5K9L5_9STRE|nr:hypothetical protein [Streptococcus pseudoporcinus]EFR43653.1 hypothetical protein HMPREF9320_1238 [Streptococcus pseudoporcinus SPIN 20026]EHI64421.1 hypothetical protein STRPS_0759 [Streptococcus pseudoporcinus LQ 940-04]VEF93684.1 Uncharacterised protein [Streptococcus pseudoporcinus]
MITVANTTELIEALTTGVEVIQISRSMTLSYPINLPKGTTLKGLAQEDGTLPSLFFSHSDGLILHGESSLENLSIVAMQDKKAIMMIPQQVEKEFGKINLKNLEVDGQVSLIFRNPTLTADVTVEKVHVNSADTRTYLEQPQKYGVNVLQGAFTLYNFNPSQDSVVTADITGLSIGSEGHPVIGSGVFISGFNDQGGQVKVPRMELKDIYSTGLIPQGVSDFITGAVFIVYGTTVEKLVQDGKVVTYGVNDMVLDAWGLVHEWIVNEEVISYGPSGVGFVNFGTVDYFKAEKGISTYGLGARAYNQYDGTLKEGYFHNVRTYNDGAVGIQISKKVGKIVIDGDIITHGGLGLSLVKGVNIELPAYALSIKNGGEVESLTINGDIITNGDKVMTIAMEEEGQLNQVTHSGQVVANGYQSHAFENERASKFFN